MPTTRKGFQNPRILLNIKYNQWCSTKLNTDKKYSIYFGFLHHLHLKYYRVLHTPVGDLTSSNLFHFLICSIISIPKRDVYYRITSVSISIQLWHITLWLHFILLYDMPSQKPISFRFTSVIVSIYFKMFDLLAHWRFNGTR